MSGCCCSSPACRQYGCQAGNKLNPYAGQLQQQGLGAFGSAQYQPYAELTGAMQRLAAALEKYNENAKPIYTAPKDDPA